jgi:hypothetical protein
MVLAYRHPESPYLTTEVSLRGLEKEATYQLTHESFGGLEDLWSGELLMARLTLTVLERGSVTLITYRRVRDEDK